jgi:hypothetical protein
VAGCVAIAAVACSGGDGSAAKLSKTDPLATVATAMAAARSGHINGAIDSPAQPAGAPLSGEWQGDLRGQLQANATFVARDRTLLPTELRVVQNKMYFSRTVATLTAEPTLSLFTRTGKYKKWRSANLGGIVNAIPSAFSPAALVQWLQQLHTTVKTSSGDKVAGQKTTRITTTRPLTVGIWTNSTVELDVDGEARVVAVKISSGSGGAHYDVTDFGVAVSVTPPPAAAIETRSELPAKEPAGPFATVKSGTNNGVQWALQRAPGTNGTQCWRWQATPPLPQAGLKRPSDPRCVTRVPSDADPEDTVTFVVDGNGTGAYNALAVALPAGAKDLTLGFVGGKTQPLPTSNNLAVWVGPAEQVPGYLGLTLADGTKLDCGAGAISVPADLNDPNATANAAGAPFGCLQHTS